jgi:hypothetical protein
MTRVHSGRVERVQESSRAQRPGAHALGVEGTHQSNSLTPTRQEVLCRRMCASEVRHRDMVELAVHSTLSQQNHRESDLQLRRIPGAQPDRREDQPVGHPPTGAAQNLELPLTQAAGLFEQHRVPTALRRPDDFAGKLTEGRKAELRDCKRDQPGTPQAQVSRREVHLVAQLLNRGEHAGPGRAAHMWEAIDHIRDGLDRDTGQARCVSHGRGQPLAPPLDRSHVAGRRPIAAPTVPL